MRYDASDRVIRNRVVGIHPETNQKDMRWSETEYYYDKAGRVVSIIEHLFEPGIQGIDELLSNTIFL